MSDSWKMLLFASAVVLLLSLEQVNGQGNCRNVFCRGGLYDRCFECGSYCPPTCENPRPQICPQACILNVCQCTGGTVRGPNGRCIWPSQCPRRSLYSK
ncbi:serine protease inhibitor swm-1-like [Chelonus insularis]|uniref:serine protease inhibitor swm-1-like n=1 Tax=Chelonus insularis TaxID=460826 RepID=UPI00158ACA85|nr:serine protease inhibitor swm-1-like [Chelonus insularis]